MSTAEVNLAYGDNRVNDQLIDLAYMGSRRFHAIKIDDGEIFIVDNEKRIDRYKCYISGHKPFNWSASVELDKCHILLIENGIESVNDQFNKMSPEPYGEGLYGYDFYTREIYTCMVFETMTADNRKHYLKKQLEEMCHYSKDHYRFPSFYGE